MHGSHNMIYFYSFPFIHLSYAYIYLKRTEDVLRTDGSYLYETHMANLVFVQRLIARFCTQELFFNPFTSEFSVVHLCWNCLYINIRCKHVLRELVLISHDGGFLSPSVFRAPGVCSASAGASKWTEERKIWQRWDKSTTPLCPALNITLCFIQL